MKTVRELTLRAAIAGVGFGALFGAANAYLGLRVGMTVSTSIPVAVLTVALFRATGARASILEANVAQTIGSASTALATGGIFTIPALFLWGMAPSYLQIAIVALLGGVLGISAMIPLRELLIVRAADELPYPEGRACAEVLRAGDGGSLRGAWIFRGLVVGAVVKLALGLFRVVPDAVHVAVPGVPNGEVGLEIAPALIAVGYILGYRQAAIVVAGSLLSSLVIIPLVTLSSGASVGSAGDVWAHQVRYVGAGAVATAGAVTVARSLPAMARSLAAVARGLYAARVVLPERARDLPSWVVVTGIGVVVLAVAFVPGVLGAELPVAARAACAVGVAVLGVAFVTVASRIVGLVGVSSQPTSGITLVTLLVICGVFAAFGWTSPPAKAAALLVGAIVAIAASKAGDISQDLKTGQLVGATPALQQLGQYLGAATACWAVAGTLLFLGRAYEYGSAELPAPQATLMKTIVEGVLAGTLPWNLVASGVGVALTAMLAGVGGLAFAIGVYLPLASMTPLLVGGVARALADRASRGATPSSEEAGAGVLAASGLVAGEGLAGVAVAALVGAARFPRPAHPLVDGAAGAALALALAVALAALLVRAGRQGPRGGSGAIETTSSGDASSSARVADGRSTAPPRRE